MLKQQTDSCRARRSTGAIQVLVAVYGILALAATGRSAVQILDRFDEAPVAYTLSALSAVVYVLATVSLVSPGPRWRKTAWIAIGFELAGVVIVGAISVLSPSLLGLSSVNPFGRQSTVWSVFGAGYLCVPLLLPVLGLWWLHTDAVREEAASA
ncbi:hypothetical protein NB037_01875 [Rathayibacter sp. ZW T2_19]|uniref:Integral membrane protein n=1 Tax=Rathayibacter rubneri TaxID=2950106 RepID=A0A9X2IR72_9MICO|nr:hypothetical protein [Rathayibacter rubneri]MCM6761156.1 hypothetical protein [Rathayibacter rubneri]